MPSLIELAVVAIFAATVLACASSSDAPSGPSAATPDALEGAWYVEWIEDRPVIDRSPAHFVFWKGGSVGGNASCGSLRGKWSLEDDELSLQCSGTRRNDCVPALQEQQERLVSALPRAERATIDSGMLTLTTAAGDPILRASRQDGRNETATIRGTVSYRERIALAPGHTLEVTLADVSLMDVASTILARETIPITGQVPIPYELKYDPARAAGGPRFAVSARILDPEGKLAWVSTSQHAALEDGPGDETVDIRVDSIKR